ncbi:MAG: monooxygenase [Nannocystaceae bacterium]|nr:monooxygenase [Deltaproteobacteria bacterium]MBP7290837.1 monooxygenase [Nannocystaceae bacterium]
MRRAPSAHTHVPPAASLLAALSLALACGADDPQAGAAEAGASEGGDTEAGSEGGSADGSTAGSDGAPASTSGGTEASVVYWRDVKPILDARCGACHSDDGVAPFSLTSYQDAAVYAETLPSALLAGLMPPWPADGDCNDYLYDPSLDDAQIQTIVDWVDQGAAEGDPNDVGAPLPVTTATLPEVDFTVAMAEPHTPAPPMGGLDEHRCFLVDWPATSDVYVTGYEVLPGNRKVVHHLVARMVDPADVADFEAQDADEAGDGWTCGSGTGMAGGGGALLGVWVPGAGASVLPEGTGMLVPTGSKLLLNMHYNTVMGDTSPDQTAVAFDVEDSVERVGVSQFVADPTWPVGDNMLIPAGDAASEHVFDRALPSSFDVHAIGLHMHTLGTEISLAVDHQDGSRSCGVDIPRWDFGWQLGYRLAAPIHVEAGDHVVLRCNFDNSPANQAVVDGVPRTPVDVTWGEDTYDEMCLGFVYITPG